jgi:hypothetical protein
VIPGSWGIPDETLHTIVSIPWNDSTILERTLRNHAHELAAVITEPIMMNVGTVLPQEGYLERMRELTEQYQIVMILDEIISGFRLAPGGAQEYFNVKPDLATYGKALAAGYPISAVAGNREIMELAQPGRVSFSGTYHANPLCIAAADATLSELLGNDGAAYTFIGCTSGVQGGGFIYTNRDSLSLGIVVGIGALMDSAQHIESFQLMESFKQLPEVSSVIEGGETVEYSAHAIPEGGLGSVQKLYSNGILVVGDAAGFALNMGIIVRGMDFAIASGVLAAEAIKAATRDKDFSARSLASYEALLNHSFVMKDLQTFKNVWNVLDNPRLFTTYPEAICSLMMDLMSIGTDPKPKLSSTIIKHFRKNFLNLSSVRDALRLMKI